MIAMAPNDNQNPGALTAHGSSNTTQNNAHDSTVVAEVRIERIYLGRLQNDKFDDLFCECTVLQGFKMPVATNRLTLRLNFAARPRSGVALQDEARARVAQWLR